MPLTRYFFVVGTVLLALLFILNGYLAKPQVTASTVANSPTIRIHSDRKWPERIVFDTVAPTIIPPQVASPEGNVAAPASLVDIPAKAHERDAMAQLRPSDVIQLQPITPKLREPQPERHKIAKRRAMPPTFRVARQWRFEW
jgi:hypothetical protein